MATFNSRDRLQPSLLDRLLDDAPHNASESNEARVLTRQQLREAVLRDLSWLFNSTRPEPEPASLRADEIAMWAEAPEARHSVLNYGVPAFAGSTLSSLDTRAMERAIAQAVRSFEPRIDSQSLEVEVAAGSRANHHNTLKIIIRGRMWSQPVPLELMLAADMDVETGHTRVRELRA